MRYYDIFVNGAPGVFQPAPNGATWSSHPWGGDRADPAAQQVEFQLMEIRPADLFLDQSTLTIHGVSWEQIGQQANLVGKQIKIMGGMKPGLPLATQQSKDDSVKLLLEGEIFKCWGNWVGTEMSIGMTIITSGQSATGGSIPQAPGGGGTTGGGNAAPSASTNSMRDARQIRYNRTGPRSIDRWSAPRISQQSNLGDFGGFGGIVSSIFGDATQSVGGMTSSLFGGQGGLVYPLNFIHNMQANMPMSQSIQETLSKVFPNANLDIQISDALKLGYQDAGMYQSFSQFASYMKDLSHSIMGTNGYLGVNMTTHGKTIKVWDGTKNGGVTQISAYDLIGQPTWVEQSLIHIGCVLRGDLYAPDLVSLPDGIIIGVEAGGTFSQLSSKQRESLSFSGVFRILKVMHTGDFRNPDGVQWSTHYECQELTSSEAASVANAAQIANSNQAQNPANNPPTDQVPSDITSISPMAWGLMNRPTRGRKH